MKPVPALIFPLTAIPAKGLEVDVAIPDTGAVSEKAGFGVNALTLNGHLTPLNSEYLFRGRISGVHEHPCDRCLQPSAMPFAIDVAWLFEPGLGMELLEVLGEQVEVSHEDECANEPKWVYSGEGIDLSQALWEEIILAAPGKFLCGENCAGLCPHCGANLNENPCDCASRTSTGHPGLSALADMFPDLRPKEE